MRLLVGLVLSVSLVIGSTVFAADAATENAAKKDAPAAEVKTEKPAEAKPAPAAEVKAEKAVEVKAAPAAEVKVVKPVDPEAVVVTINGTVIKEKDIAGETNKRLEAQAKRMPQGMEINDMMRNQVRMGIVDMKVEQALIEQKLAAKKITVADEQVTKEIEKIAAQQNLKMEDVPAEIAKFGMTMDDLKSQIRMKVQMDLLIASEMKDGEVKDEDVKKFYDDNPQYFEKPEQARVAHILVMTQGKSDEEKTAAKTKIEGLLKRAKAGEDFAALAKEFSEDPGSKDKGGEYTFPRGQMVPAFETAAFTLKDGEISDVVETEYGFHIIKKFEQLKAEKTPLEEVKDKIKQHLTQQKNSQFWETYSKAMHDEAKIEYSESEKKLREENARPPMMPEMAPPAEAKPAPEAKAEAKPEAKPEVKPEVKAEVKPEVKPEAAPKN